MNRYTLNYFKGANNRYKIFNNIMWLRKMRYSDKRRIRAITPKYRWYISYRFFIYKFIY